jgi:ABC-type phosphonate transport system ATPase subunit
MGADRSPAMSNISDRSVGVVARHLAACRQAASGWFELGQRDRFSQVIDDETKSLAIDVLQAVGVAQAALMALWERLLAE